MPSLVINDVGFEVQNRQRCLSTWTCQRAKHEKQRGIRSLPSAIVLEERLPSGLTSI